MMSSKAAEKFTEFYETWLAQLENLLATSTETACDDQEYHQDMVRKLTAHLKEYYKVKWAWAHEDVLAFFSPVWLSPFESAYLWITGWKPSMAFRLIETLKRAKPRLAESMSEEQVEELEALRLQIRSEEEEVEKEMERHQVAMADRKMLRLACMCRSDRSSVAARELSGLVDMALKELLSGLERVMKMADCVRLKTLKGVLEVLASPEQSMEFLAATSMLQIQMRKWGRDHKDINKQ